MYFVTPILVNVNGAFAVWEILCGGPAVLMPGLAVRCVVRYRVATAMAAAVSRVSGLVLRCCGRCAFLVRAVARPGVWVSTA